MNVTFGINDLAPVGAWRRGINLPRALLCADDLRTFGALMLPSQPIIFSNCIYGNCDSWTKKTGCKNLSPKGGRSSEAPGGSPGDQKNKCQAPTVRDQVIWSLLRSPDLLQMIACLTTFGKAYGKIWKRKDMDFKSIALWFGITPARMNSFRREFRIAASIPQSKHSPPFPHRRVPFQVFWCCRLHRLHIPAKWYLISQRSIHGCQLLWYNPPVRQIHPNLDWL